MRTTIFGAFYMFMFLASFFYSSDAIAQSCNSELTVDKGRDSRSADEFDSTQFQMRLTNNGYSQQTYQIDVSNYQGTFKVGGKSPAMLSTSNKVNAVVLQNKIQKSTITVPARSTVAFELAVSVPSGTPVKKWAGLQVNAVSNDCPQGAVTKLVKLYVADPTEE